MSEARKLAAVLASDVVGYRRLAGADEDRILARLRALRRDLIAHLPFVNSASAVTGRFDIIVDMVVAGDVADLYHVELFPGVGEPGEIVRSETFVVMTSCNKWVRLPKGCWSDDTEAVAPRRTELR
jgi:hypothetical protein